MLQQNAGAEAQAAGTEIMDMHITGAAMPLELEMMMLDVRHAMAHLLFAG